MIEQISSYLTLENIQKDGLPIATYGFCIAVYGIVVYAYYKHLSKRDVFKFEREKGTSFWVRFKNIIRSTSHYLSYIIVYPFITVIWLGIISLLLLVLSKQRPIESVLMLSMSIVFATRIAAYIKEELAMDLAKLIPFGMLGVFLVDPDYFSISVALERIYSIPSHWPLILHSIILIMILEWILRIIYWVKTWFRRS